MAHKGQKNCGLICSLTPNTQRFQACFHTFSVKKCLEMLCVWGILVVLFIQKKHHLIQRSVTYIYPLAALVFVGK